MKKNYDLACAGNGINKNGIKWISWEDFARLSASMAEVLAGRGVDAVVGIARAGLFPATAVAYALRCEMYPVRVTRSNNDEPVHSKPVWKVPVSTEVSDRVVAVIDEMADTGETLTMVCGRVLCMGARTVLSAVLVKHPGCAPSPDLALIESDGLVVFPWKQRVFVDGRWQAHPEVLSAVDRSSRPEKGDSQVF